MNPSNNNLPKQIKNNNTNNKEKQISYKKNFYKNKFKKYKQQPKNYNKKDNNNNQTTSKNNNIFLNFSEEDIENATQIKKILKNIHRNTLHEKNTHSKEIKGKTFNLSSLLDREPNLFKFFVNNFNLFYTTILYYNIILTDYPSFLYKSTFPLSKHLNTLIIIKGNVIKINQVLVKNVKKKIHCQNCYEIENIEQKNIINNNNSDNTITSSIDININVNKKTMKCSLCGNQKTLRESFDKAVETQIIKIQNMGCSQNLSQTIEIRLPSYLCNKIHPGNSIVVVGCVSLDYAHKFSNFNFNPQNINQNLNYSKIGLKLYIDAYEIDINNTSLNIMNKTNIIGFELQKYLLNNYCKEVYGYFHVKLGIIITVLGGNKQSLVDKSNAIKNNKESSKLNSVDNLQESTDYINKSDETILSSFLESSYDKIEEEELDNYSMSTDLDDITFSSISEKKTISNTNTDMNEKKLIEKEDTENNRENILANKRLNSHCLLVGPSSTAKTRLLNSIPQLIAHPIRINGVNTTEAGLTSCAVKNGKEWVLEPGALILADNNVCIIDGFEYLSMGAGINNKAGLLEVMEQQTISIAKAGLMTSLNARCSIIAAQTHKLMLPKINPLSNTMNNKMNNKYEEDTEDFLDYFIKKTKISPPLFSRFDLIFYMEPIIDKNCVNYMVDILTSNNKIHVDKIDDNSNINNTFNVNNIDLSFNPKFNSSSLDYLSKYYTILSEPNLINKLNKNYTCNTNNNTTIRTFEGMIRLVYAHGKIMKCDIDDFSTFTIIFLMEMSIRGTGIFTKLNDKKINITNINNSCINLIDDENILDLQILDDGIFVDEKKFYKKVEEMKLILNKI